MDPELKKKAEEWFEYLRDIYAPDIIRGTMPDEELIACYNVASQKFAQYATDVRNKIGMEILKEEDPK